MTLALYGKTRRRQGSLILLGVFAVLMALLTGLMLRGTTVSAAPVELLNHGFGTSDNNTVSTWNSAWADDDGSGSDAAIRAGDGVSSSAALRLRNTQSASVGVNTTGYNSISLSFACRGHADNGSSDDLRLDYSTNGGSSWTTAFATFETSINNDATGCPNNAYATRTVSFGAVSAANNNANFRVRFASTSHNSSDENERLFIDNVVVKGEAIAAPTATPTAVPPTATPTAAGGTIPAPQVNNPGFEQCSPIDVHLVLDSSGSIGGSLGTMKTNITGMTTQLEAALPGVNWRATTFQDPDPFGSSNPPPVFNGTGSWSATPTDVNNLINAMVSDGYTPTAGAIAAAVAGGTNGANDNLMIIITDGDPNVPLGGNAQPADYWVGGAHAVAQADLARAAGWNTVVVSFGPGDTNKPGGFPTATVLQGLAGPNVVGPAGQVFAVPAPAA